LVLSRNEHGVGAIEWRRVTQTLPKPPKKVLRVALRDRFGATDTLGVTPNHPLWRAGSGWTPAGRLQPGDRVWSLERGWLRVVRVHLQHRLQRVYNLEVDGDHTYTVGALGAWVHNTCADAPYKRPGGATTKAQREFVQGRACVKCGESAERMVAGHKRALVQEYYETGTIDKQQMRSLDAIQPECPTCSAQEGAEMSRYSRAQKAQLEQKAK
jgi:Pretoxin HINT domain